jgi:hypothetical protein
VQGCQASQPARCPHPPQRVPSALHTEQRRHLGQERESYWRAKARQKDYSYRRRPTFRVQCSRKKQPVFPIFVGHGRHEHFNEPTNSQKARASWCHQPAYQRIFVGTKCIYYNCRRLCYGGQNNQQRSVDLSRLRSGNSTMKGACNAGRNIIVPVWNRYDPQGEDVEDKK